MPSSFFQFANLVSRRLLRWSIFSMGVGGWLRGRPDDLARGMGTQFFAWGAIDAAIALFGLLGNRQKARSVQAGNPDFVVQEAKKLRRLLWINAGLDIFYVSGGWWAVRKGEEKENRALWRGHGLGVIIQGAFLLIFDVWHALRMNGLETLPQDDQTS